MVYYLTSFGLHNPFIEIDFADHLIYPIANECAGGFDLDYGMLLVGEKFIIDKSVFDFIRDDKRGFLSPMANSLAILQREELLELFDVSDLVFRHKESLVKKTNALAQDYEAWLNLIRSHWHTVSMERTNFVQSFGNPTKDLINSNHFTLVNAVKKLTGKLDASTIQLYNQVIFSMKKRFTTNEKEMIVELLKPLLSHILLNDLIKYSTKSALLDWEDSAAYYDKLYSTRWDVNDTEEIIPNRARSIFNMVIPQTNPNMIKQLVKFIRDERSTSSLRNEIISLINSGNKIDEKWLISYQAQVINAGLKKEKIMKKVRWGSAIAGLFIPAATLVAEIAKEGVSSLMEDQIETGVTSNKFDWYYAMQNILKEK